MAARPALNKLTREQLIAEMQEWDEETTGMTSEMMRARLKRLYATYGPQAQRMPNLNKRKGELQEMCEALGIAYTKEMTRGDLQLAIKDYWDGKVETSKGGDLIGFGTHKTLTYQELLEKHPTYCGWVLEEVSLSSNPRFKKLATWLIDQGVTADWKLKGGSKAPMRARRSPSVKRRMEEEMSQNMDMSQTPGTAVCTPPEQENLVGILKDMSAKMDKLTERVAKMEIETGGATSSDGGFVPVPRSPKSRE